MKLSSLFLCGFAVLFVAACDRKPSPSAPAPAGTPLKTIPSSEGSEPKDTPPADMAPKPDDEPDPMQGLKQVASLPDEFYGKWRATGSSGGMAGDGDGKPADEMLAITRENKIETWKDGKLVSTVAFRIGRGRSIFGNDALQISRGGFPDVIELRGDELSISENHPDGFSWSYQRVK